MEAEFWKGKWARGEIGFHQDRWHWALECHWPALARDSREPVLVPLCGKSLDMRWLADRGHPVTGVEFEPKAVRDFFTEWGIEAQPLEGHRLVGGGVELVLADFFGYRPAEPFRLFYDRAALIALPPERRGEYIEHLARCLRRGARGLLVTLEYEQSRMDGPPFSVLKEEVEGYSAFRFELLERRDVTAGHQRFVERGLESLHEAAYYVSLRTA